ncbi:MAG: hypothetical protein JXR37_14275 [Kiritimatiellae bacterium]|nr:hypothetical protein [Kiritimatiellia bacterium]
MKKVLVVERATVTLSVPKVFVNAIGAFLKNFFPAFVHRRIDAESDRAAAFFSADFRGEKEGCRAHAARAAQADARPARAFQSTGYPHMLSTGFHHARRRAAARGANARNARRRGASAGARAPRRRRATGAAAVIELVNRLRAGIELTTACILLCWPSHAREGGRT